MAFVACDSDSAVLGLGVFAAVFTVAYARRPHSLKKFLLMLTVMLGSVKLLGLITAAGAPHKKLEAIPYKIMTADAAYWVLAFLAVLTAVLALDVPGMMVEASSVRQYSTEYAAHILGHIGAMNSQQWEHYKTQDGYEMDALVGQSGLEKAFESYLHGTDGTKLVTTSSDGKITGEVYMVEPQPGNTVALSSVMTVKMNIEQTAKIEMRRMRTLNSSIRPIINSAPHSQIEKGIT